MDNGLAPLKAGKLGSVKIACGFDAHCLHQINKQAHPPCVEGVSESLVTVISDRIFTLFELRGSKFRKEAHQKIRCGDSSVGRASACQAEGRGFESRSPLQMMCNEVVRSGRFGVQRAVTYIGMPTVTTCKCFIASLRLVFRILESRVHGGQAVLKTVPSVMSR